MDASFLVRKDADLDARFLVRKDAGAPKITISWTYNELCGSVQLFMAVRWIRKLDELIFYLRQFDRSRLYLS